MKKIPIELFGLRTEDLGQVEPRSPIVWNGLELSVCSELPYSIFFVQMQKAKELNLGIKHKVFCANTDIHTSQTIIADLKVWYRENEKTITEIAQIAYQTKDYSDSFGSNLNNLFSANKRLDIKLQDAESVLQNISNGKLITGGQGYSVKFNKKTWSYSIAKKLLPPPTFFGDNTVTITNIDNTVKIDFDPTQTFRLIAGAGLFQTSLEHYSTLNLANIVQGSRGIVVSNTIDNISIGCSENLLLSKNPNIKISFDPKAGFRLYLEQSFRYLLNFKFYQGYGIEINYDAGLKKHIVGTATTIVPRLLAGKNTTFSSDSNTTAISFVAPNFPQNPIVEAIDTDEIVGSKKTVLGATGEEQTLCSVFVNDDTSSKVLYEQKLKNINKSLANTDARISNLYSAQFDSNLLEAIKCPIKNLFNLVTVDRISNSAAYRLHPDIVMLVDAFGASQKYLDIPINFTKLLSSSQNPTFGIIGAEFSFNAYTLLEDFLQRRLASPIFTINPMDIGTRFSLVSANLDTANFFKVAKDDVLPMSYNMGWADISVPSETGVPLLFSAADYDFFAGYARNGQLNEKPVVFDTITGRDLEDLQLNYTIISNTTSVTATTSSTSITIKNNYTGDTDTIIWRKPIFLGKSSLDCMTELSSKTKPLPSTRFLARLMSEYNYSFLDAQKTINGILIQQKKIEGGVSKIFFDRLSDPEYAKYFNFLEAEGYLEQISLDRDSGKITLKPKIMRHTDTGTSIFEAFSDITSTITFLVTPLLSSEYTNVEGSCNFDNTVYSQSPCSISKTTEYLSDKPLLKKELTGT